MITIEPTKIEEAELLCAIQKRAFEPLYEKYRDEGNPYLRGTEDILRRLNDFNRYFTIKYDGKIVGGIFYRCVGKRSPWAELSEGEYYLARVYVDPEYQNRGIAREAILLCEKKFPDAKAFYVDFPQDMEKNRRSYEHAGFCDTGEVIAVDGAPVLAVYKKVVDAAQSNSTARTQNTTVPLHIQQ